MRQHQLVCGVFALLLSLLPFATLLQAERHWITGHRSGHRNGDYNNHPNDRCSDQCHDQRAVAGVITVTLSTLPAPVPRSRALPPALNPAAATSASGATTIPTATQASSTAALGTDARQRGHASVPLALNLSPDPYVPVAELNERPVLLQDIDPVLDLESASFAGNAVPTAVYVTAMLLINEHGDVDRLQIETHTLPRYLEAILVQRFAAARFLPGKIDGKPVRSALRIALQLQ